MEVSRFERQGRRLHAYYYYGTSGSWWWWVVIGVGIFVVLFASIWAYGVRRRRMQAAAHMAQAAQTAAYGGAATSGTPGYTGTAYQGTAYAGGPPVYAGGPPPQATQQQTSYQTNQTAQTTNQVHQQPEDPGEYTYNATTGEYTYVGPRVATGVPAPAGYPANLRGDVELTKQ